jgi:hypothetical protein
MQHKITDALSVLVGQPLWAASRAANMEMFQFGAKVTKINRHGSERLVGDYSLHIQCPWRLVDARGIIAGYFDQLFHPEEVEGSYRYLKSHEDGPSLCEARIDRWIKENEDDPLCVTTVDADSIGGFKLTFNRGVVLEAFPSDSVRDSEFWRLLYRNEDRNHFVVSGDGIYGE